MQSLDKEIRLLIVEDSEDDLLLLVREVKRGGYKLSFERVQTEAEMRAALSEKPWDLIIADYTLPHFSGLAAQQTLRETGLDIPLVIVSGTITDETAVSAMRSGAKDYLMKGNLRRLVPVLEREISEAKDRAERRRVEENLRKREEEEIRRKQETEAAARRFLRDTVFAVTDGRLRLIGYDEGEGLCPISGRVAEIDTPEKMTVIRARVEEAALALNMPEERAQLLATAVGEAAVNALKHAGGGVVSICSLEDRIRVGIRDYGEGIESFILPTATLMTRFSTKRSMGFGYALMLTSVDAVYLATGKQGTFIILEQELAARASEISLDQLPDVW
jgi:DNA-binding response OmpR family regulator/anti-sigma regulatory factor (Ser/Thr protein kinase)